MEVTSPRVICGERLRIHATERRPGEHTCRLKRDSAVATYRSDRDHALLKSRRHVAVAGQERLATADSASRRPRSFEDPSFRSEHLGFNDYRPAQVYYDMKVMRLDLKKLKEWNWDYELPQAPIS